MCVEQNGFRKREHAHVAHPRYENAPAVCLCIVRQHSSVAMAFGRAMAPRRALLFVSMLLMASMLALVLALVALALLVLLPLLVLLVRRPSSVLTRIATPIAGVAAPIAGGITTGVTTCATFRPDVTASHSRGDGSLVCGVAGRSAASLAGLGFRR